jgi:hypothetical protein
MKIDIDVVMSIVEDVLVEMYTSDYKRVKARFEGISTNVEDLDAHFLVEVVEKELELNNSEYIELRREFNAYLDNL